MGVAKGLLLSPRLACAREDFDEEAVDDVADFGFGVPDVGGAVGGFHVDGDLEFVEAE